VCVCARAYVFACVCEKERESVCGVCVCVCVCARARNSYIGLLISSSNSCGVVRCSHTSQGLHCVEFRF